MIIIAVFGIGAASADDGILFRGTNGPLFTTPAEFAAPASAKTGGRRSIVQFPAHRGFLGRTGMTLLAWGCPVAGKRYQ